MRHTITTRNLLNTVYRSTSRKNTILDQTGDPICVWLYNFYFGLVYLTAYMKTNMVTTLTMNFPIETSPTPDSS